MAKKRFRSRPRKLSGLITGALHPKVLKRMKISEISQNWIEVVGPLLAGKSSVSGLEEDHLVVIASSSSVAQQVKMRAGTVRERIKSIWDLDISGVKVYVGRQERKNSSSQQTRNTIRINPSPQDVKRELEYMEKRLDDEKLARALANLKATYRKRFGSDENSRKPS